MKKLYVFFMFVYTVAFSQQGINYKAIIEDDGQIVANTSIVLYFTIKENGTTDVYKETHIKTTNENGIVVTNIGEGIPTLGSFETINWTAEQFLNVGVNIGNGLVDLGTTAFNQVPYAIHAKTSGDKAFSTLNNVTSNSNGDLNNDNFVFGANQLDGSEVSRMFFNKTKGAFRAGHVNGSTYFTDVWDDTNVGIYSFATGLNTRASGYASVALGSHSSATGWESTALANGLASGANSIAIGRGSRAINDSAIAIGDNAEAKGKRSVAIGYSTAGSFLETSIGINNTEVSGSSDTFVDTDRLFVIGNGTSNSHKRDALVMLKNGNTTLNGELNVSEVQATDSGDADMKAYIYGLIVGSNGNKANASSGGFTVVRLGTGQYRISFNNPPSSHTDYLVLGTLHQEIGFVRTSKFQEYFEIRTYNTSEALTDINFNFVVYKK
ncbi:hypothetical protein [Seonamhaeicola marinus]|uniref:Trimeric autotransporter adhesin YadA-like head domain-containing protein n=1 Tax=Seonamhaeicola marinus TaxID=1912246 RepID=A0A5D0J9B1_9FLAO|nr:hypothetical protein [Seonamhaeicola marinus]TYA92166.1 hypothetical protein FUA24_01675 [Seonamhaeicola marinus]